MGAAFLSRFRVGVLDLGIGTDTILQASTLSASSSAILRIRKNYLHLLCKTCRYDTYLANNIYQICR
jgi:hypothetical protein